MVETQPYKVPPTSPVDVPMEGRTHPAIVQGRNSIASEIGKAVNRE